jgi:hypothetical protein
VALDDWCDLDLAYLLLFDDHPDLHESALPKGSAGLEEVRGPLVPRGDVRTNR